jgi:hypothetical protein
MTKTEQRLWDALADLVSQVDEDCPMEYRTKHLKSSMQEAADLLNEISNEGENDEDN